MFYCIIFLTNTVFFTEFNYLSLNSNLTHPLPTVTYSMEVDEVQSTSTLLYSRKVTFFASFLVLFLNIINYCYIDFDEILYDMANFFSILVNRLTGYSYELLHKRCILS